MNQILNTSGRVRLTTSALVAATMAGLLTFAPARSFAHDTEKAPGNAATSEPMDHSKSTGMEGMSMTGDADYDFATNMRKHHQMALVMSEAELKNGKDAQMKHTASDIITAQKKEIASFDRWLAAHKQPATKDASKP